MRHRQRHVHQTLVDYVTNVLTTGGWLSTTPPLGAPKMTVLDYEPQGAGEIPPVQTVCISIGDQMSGPFDLGGGLLQAKYYVFVDVYPSSESIGIAIAEDVADSFNEMYIPLYDYTSAPRVATGEALEMTKIMVQPVPSVTKMDNRPWRVVKATAILDYNPPA